MCTELYGNVRLFVKCRALPYKLFMGMEERTEIRMTTEQRKRWQAAACADRRTLTDWIRIQLDDAADRQLQASEAEKVKRK